MSSCANGTDPRNFPRANPSKRARRPRAHVVTTADMRPTMHRIILVLCTILCVSPVAALIEISSGNNPVADQDWPAGSLDVANAKNRLGYWVGPPFGGGEYHFAFRGDTQALANAVSA